MLSSAGPAPPSRIPWPPILVVATPLLGLGLDRMSGGAFRGLIDFSRAAPFAQIALMLALAIDFWSVWTLWRHRTTLMPHRAAAHLVTDGPFRYSRNPIYVAHVALVACMGVFMASPFTLLLTPLAAYGLQKLGVEPEERHLLSRFGNDYRAYMARTRRWL